MGLRYGEHLAGSQRKCGTMPPPAGLPSTTAGEADTGTGWAPVGVSTTAHGPTARLLGVTRHRVWFLCSPTQVQRGRAKMDWQRRWGKCRRPQMPGILGVDWA